MKYTVTDTSGIILVHGVSKDSKIISTANINLHALEANSKIPIEWVGADGRTKFGWVHQSGEE